MDDCRIGEVDELGIDSNAVIKYIKNTWEREITLSLPSFYNWQFRQSPDNAGKDRSVLLVDSNNNILGFIGLNCRKFYLDGQTTRGAELTSWIISEEARGKGYGKAMLQHLKEKHNVLIGQGISEAAIPTYTRLDFNYLRYLNRYVRIFNLDVVRPISKISKLGYKLIQQHKIIPKMAYKSYNINFSDIVEFEFLHKNFNCFSREGKYLEWRYENHPIYKYESYRIVSKGESGIVILRVDEKESSKIVHVIDVFSNKSSIATILNFLEDFCRENDVDLIDFYCTSDKIGRMFWRYGWFSTIDDHYIQVPGLFYPIEMRSPPTTSLILWDKYNNSIVDLSRLYFTKGDCDMDRPTINYLKEKGLL